MSEYVKYYRESLYPFQNGVMKLVDGLGTPFYLTGGTALSRHYFNHRYSDPLDFFLNNDPAYPEYVRQIFGALENAQITNDFRIDYSSSRRADNFTQIILRRNGLVLKIDLVNDVAQHFGEFESGSFYSRIDSWRNILSNKLTALGRLEIKDYADL